MKLAKSVECEEARLWREVTELLRAAKKGARFIESLVDDKCLPPVTSDIPIEIWVLICARLAAIGSLRCAARYAKPTVRNTSRRKR